MRAVLPSSWHTTSHHQVLKGREMRGRARGRAARAVRRGRVCKARRGGGSACAAARRAASCCGEMAPFVGRHVSGEGDRSNRGGDNAGAHARHIRWRTLGLCQLTLHPRPISRLSSASLPSLVASFTALPIAALELPIAALELQEPICSARCWRQVLAGRESRPTSSLTRNRSRKKSGSRGPKGAKRDKLHEGASTGTGRAPELAARASAHAR